jgi:hypothetical protein
VSECACVCEVFAQDGHCSDRFDTLFFIARAKLLSGASDMTQPAPASAAATGDEVDMLEWASPSALLQRYAQGSCHLVHPTWYLLHEVR